ncbi:hypothetical protein [Mycoplasma sp. E35C]|uniref:hypothetical protein n=1 Tax=Mycoplasma sp. E35C TaxID=2801918 RepID=UPI001CA3FB00|nr:hypothetical protein [Mycoplasma sp. E35C]QZX49265.1 hypothetical protein JJE79_00660 [Mycoplasma sp. E35C]
MKFKKINRLISLLGLSSLISSALASCSSVQAQDSNPNNQKRLIDELNDVVNNLKAKDFSLKQTSFNEQTPTKINEADLSITIDQKFNNFKPIIKIINRFENQGKIEVQIYFVSKTNENIKSVTNTVEINGLKGVSQYLSSLIFNNQRTKSIDLGDANWATYETVLKNIDSLFKKRFNKIVQLQDLTIKADLEVNKAPEKNANNDVVITLSPINNTKILLTNKQATNDPIEIEIDSFKIANVKPTQVSLKAWNGEVESTNNYNEYRTANGVNVAKVPPNSAHSIVEEDLNKKVNTIGQNAGDRIKVNAKYYKHNEDNLSLLINDKTWIIDPISIPRKGNSIADYSILALVRFGNNKKYFATNAYQFKIYAKKFYKQDVRSNANDITDRTSIMPEVFSYNAIWRTNVNLFLENNLDREKLVAFITYDDPGVDGKYDNDLNTNKTHGNKIFSVPPNTDASWKNTLDEKWSTNYIFVIGYSNTKKNAKIMFNQNLTFLNIKYGA